MRTDLLAYLGAVALITATPGADTLLVVRTTARYGRRAGLSTAAGSASGLLGWGAASAAGVAALLAASAIAFTLLKLAGAAYLVYLGVQSIRSAGSGAFGTLDRSSAGSPPAARAAYRLGLVTNLLNPKAALFFSALLPQFLDRHDAVLPVFALLTAIASAASLLGLAAWALAVHRGGGLLRRPAVGRALDRVTGGVLIALGLRVALEKA
jgi:threonine/homoserine/homoserine lactone efflux protein